jgi:GNAT superfamily N-acetyltransferase
VRIVEFTDQYADLGRLVGVDPDDLRAHDGRHEEHRPRWLAYDDGGAVEPDRADASLGVERASAGGDGAAVGVLDAWVRPDDRCFVDVQGPPAVQRALLDTAVAAMRRDLFAEADESEVDRWTLLGFAPVRREGRFTVPVDPTVTGLPRDATPDGYAIVSADAVTPADLLELDNDLRQDVPGSRGWRAGARWFHEETYASPAYDPATYLVAVHVGTGAHVALVRVWWNPADWGERAGPRLGLVAVRPDHRRRGLAAALLGRVFAVAHDRAAVDVPAEIDDSNGPMLALAGRVGARRVGTTVELRLDV